MQTNKKCITTYEDLVFNMALDLTKPNQQHNYNSPNTQFKKDYKHEKVKTDIKKTVGAFFKKYKSTKP